MGNNNSQLISSRFLAGCPPIPPLPKESEVLQSFQQLLREKNVATVVMEEMEAMESMETKWMYVVINKQLVSSSATAVPVGGGGGGAVAAAAAATNLPTNLAALGLASGASCGEREFLDPKQCVQQILVLQYRTQDSKDLFRAIRIHMILKSKDWVDRFLAAEGLEALLLLLSTSAETFVSSDPTITAEQKEKLELQLVLFQMEILNVLFLLTNFNQGINALVQAPTCFASLLVLFECCRVNLVKSRILKLLGIICCQSQASQKAVLAAFTARTASNDASGGRRFKPLLQVLLQSPNDLGFVVTCLTFINILLNTTLQSEERKGIRDELESFGLLRFLAEVKQAQASKESAAAASLPPSSSSIPTTTNAVAFETQLQIFYKHFGHDVISKIHTIKKPVAPPLVAASLPLLPPPPAGSNKNMFSPIVTSASTSSTTLAPTKGTRETTVSAPPLLKPALSPKEQFVSEFKCELTALDEFQRQRVHRLFQRFLMGLETTQMPPQQLFEAVFATSNLTNTSSPSTTSSSSSPLLSTLLRAVAASFPSSNAPAPPPTTTSATVPEPTSAPPPPVATEPSVTPPAADTSARDDVARFRKLLSMGAPLEAVKAKMRQAGLDPELLGQPTSAAAAAATSSSSANATSSSESTASTSSSSGPSTTSAPALTKVTKVKVRDHPDYAKFFKLLAMGAPAEAVRAKMKHAGLQIELLESPDSEIDLLQCEASDDSSCKGTTLPPPAPISSGSSPLDPRAALAGLFARKNNQIHPTATSARVAVKDDPQYAGFFKLLSMGAPAEMVRAKMRIAGLRPELLETPEAMMPTGPPGATDKFGKTDKPKLSLPLPPPIRTPKSTTKSFYWQQLRREEITGTIWQELHQASSNQLPVVLSSSDLASLEEDFPAQPDSTRHANNKTPHQRTHSFDNACNSPCPTPPRVVFLIDRSRSNNISIIIKQFKMSPAAIREAILRLDPNVLTIERVQALLKILPTEEEVALITSFQGDANTLNEAEKILKELIAVPRLKPRLVAFQAKLQFPVLLREIHSKLVKIQRACREINDSQEFKTILLVVLQVGNKMNEGTQRGNAKGFHLADLLKLSQLRSSNQKSFTLLHFVARLVRDKKGNVVQLGHALTCVNDVQSVAIGPELQSEMDKIEELCEQIKTEVNAISLKNCLEVTNDPFEQVMHQFLNESTQAIGSLRQEMHQTIEDLRSTISRFEKSVEPQSLPPPPPLVTSTPAPTDALGGEASTDKSNNMALWTQAPVFFQTIYEFSVALMKADRENELKRMRIERQQKRQQQTISKPSSSSALARDKEPEGPEQSYSHSREEEDEDEREDHEDSRVENIWQPPRSGSNLFAPPSKVHEISGATITSATSSSTASTSGSSSSNARNSLVAIKPQMEIACSNSSAVVLFSPVDTRSVLHLMTRPREANKERTTSSSSSTTSTCSPELELQEDNNNAVV